MGTIVDATIPSREFALHKTFTALPNAEFEVVRVVAHGGSPSVPLLWASGVEKDAVKSALEDDPTTDDVSILANTDDRTLVWIEWARPIRQVFRALVQAERSLLAASCHADGWELRLLFPREGSVSETFDAWRARDINLTVRCVHDLNGAFDTGGFDLTEQQYHALVAALEADFYEIPRGATLEELAKDLGVSHQALSERLRRGQKTILEEALLNGHSKLKPVTPQP